MSRKLRKLWAEVEVILKEAKRIMLDSDATADSFNDVSFNEHLSHNELGLALETIEDMGENLKLPPEFWQCLIKAANLMGLNEHAKKYQGYLSK